MKKKITLFILLILFAIMGCAREDDGTSVSTPPVTAWHQTYGGEQNDRGYGIAEIPGEGFYVCGLTESYGVDIQSFILLRLSNQGAILWERIYQYNLHAKAVAIGIADNNDAIVVVGSESCLLRINEDGDEVWCNYLNTNITELFGIGELLVLHDGSILISCVSMHSWTYVPTLIKCDPSGTEVWNRTYLDEQAMGMGVSQSMGGGFLLYGTIGDTIEGPPESTYTLPYLIKTDSNGNDVWTHVYSFDHSGSDSTLIRDHILGYSCVEHSSGSIYLLCTRQCGTSSTRISSCILKLNNSGEEIERVQITISGNEYGMRILESLDGNLVVAGLAQYVASETSEFWMQCYDENLNLLWTSVLDNLGDIVLSDAIMVSDGGYALTGFTNWWVDEDEDILVVKTD